MRLSDGGGGDRAVALEGPDVRGQRFFELGSVLNQRISQNLPVVVIDEVAAGGVGEDDERDEPDQNELA